MGNSDIIVIDMPTFIIWNFTIFYNNWHFLSLNVFLLTKYLSMNQ